MRSWSGSQEYLEQWVLLFWVKHSISHVECLWETRWAAILSLTLARKDQKVLTLPHLQVKRANQATVTALDAFTQPG